MKRSAALFLTPLALFACHPEGGIEAPGPAILVAKPGGLSSISARELRGHVEELAHDSYGGRATLEPGYERAAAYLADHFQRFGLKPLPGHDYRMPYTLLSSGFDESATTATLVSAAGEKKLVGGVDFVPFGFSDRGSAEGEVVFAGYGITAPDLDWDDYKGLDVEGKIVFVLRHNPGYGVEGDRFAETPHSRFINKALNAQKHGARGMILVTGPATMQGPDDLRFRRGLRVPPTEEEKRAEKERAAARDKAMAARAAKKAKGKKKGAAKRKKGEPVPSDTLIAIHVSQEAATHFLPEGTDLEALQRAVDAGEPVSGLALASAGAQLAVVETETPIEVQADNVVGYLEGSDSALRDEFVVIGGHFDHLGGHDAGEEDGIYNGADDNASGTAGVLELAEAFGRLPTPPRRSMLFIGFSGEERGLLGSRAMLAEEQIPADKIAFMLNLDMIGRNSDHDLEVVGHAYATQLSALIEDANASLGLPILDSGTSYSGASDHHPFFLRDIPVLFFFTGLHDDYHGTGDHADKLDYGRMEKIVRLAYGVADGVANAEASPAFVHQITWLGVAVEKRGGAAVITSVQDGTRGHKAGFVVGDELTALGETAVSADTIGAAFRGIRPGTTVSAQVLRDGTTTSVEFERAQRGYLGVITGSVSDEQRAEFNLPGREGVLMAKVTPDSPASQAGLKDGDILTKIDGEGVGRMTLGARLGNIGAGETVTLTIIRDEKAITLPITLGTPPERNAP